MGYGISFKRTFECTFMKTAKKVEEIENLAQKLQTAGDPSRLKILCYLFDAKRACVSDIAGDLGVSIATASHHLQTLAKAGLLESEREGKRICYLIPQGKLVLDLKKFICKYR